MLEDRRGLGIPERSLEGGNPMVALIGLRANHVQGVRVKTRVNSMSRDCGENMKYLSAVSSKEALFLWIPPEYIVCISFVDSIHPVVMYTIDFLQLSLMMRYMDIPPYLYCTNNTKLDLANNIWDKCDNAPLT